MYITQYMDGWVACMVKGVGGPSVVDMERDTSRSETDWGRKDRFERWSERP